MAPLLINSAGGRAHPPSCQCAAGAVAAGPSDGTGLDTLHELASEAKSAHLKSYDRQKSAEVRKNVIIGLMFLMSTAAQIYLGVKVISFVGHWDDGDASAKRIQVRIYTCMQL